MSDALRTLVRFLTPTTGSWDLGQISSRSRGSSSAQYSVQWQWDRRQKTEGSAEGGLSALPLLSVVSRAASGVVGSSGVVGRALEGQRAAFVPF